MTVAIAEHAPGQGVIEADVDLIDRRGRDRQGTDRRRGLAYAVDAQGTLIAHPDINRVLAHTSFAALPQVRAALSGPTTTRSDVVATGRDPDGGEVISAFHRVDPPGWWVFVEEPAQRGVRTNPVGNLAHGTAPRRVPAGGNRDERAAGAQSRQTDPVDPGRRREDRLRCARSADQGLEPRRTGRSRRGVQPDGWTAGGVLCRARASGPGQDSGADERPVQAGRAGPRAGGSEPAQVAVPRQHVPRTADSVERDQRVLAGLTQAAVRRDQREAGRVPRRHPRLGTASRVADRRRPRPLEGRGGTDRTSAWRHSRCPRRSIAGS